MGKKKVSKGTKGKNFKLKKSELTTEKNFPSIDKSINSKLFKQTPNSLKKKKKSSNEGFTSFNLNPLILKGIKKKGYNFPTPIQRKAIPSLLLGRDVMAMARTGSGKTAAFLIPLFEKLKCEHSTVVGVKSIIIAPARELALQIFKFIQELAHYTDLRFCCLIGGEKLEDQFEKLSRNPDIVVATPGRLLHILKETKISLKSVKYLVCDEADRIFENGFAQQMDQIIHLLPRNKQVALFSATLPSLLLEFSKIGLKEPDVIRLDVDTKISNELKSTYFVVRTDEKIPTLFHLINKLDKNNEQTIIFCCTRYQCDLIYNLFLKFEYEAAVIYGSMESNDRKNNLQKFSSKQCNFLIVTDVAARGIDIPDLDNVINFDFPDKPKLFVHRVGRVARAGRKGCAYSLILNNELPYMIDLNLFLGRSFSNVKVEDENFDGCYGTIPISNLDLEEISKVYKEDAYIKQLLKSAGNGYKQYIQTREDATKSSIKRAKLLKNIQTHPYYIDNFTENEGKAIDYLSSIKKFKPKLTIFEQNKNTEQDNLMKYRRKLLVKNRVTYNDDELNNDESKEEKNLDTITTSIIPINSKSKLRSLLESTKKKSFKDPNFFMSSEKPMESQDEKYYSTNNLDKLDVLNLNPEDKDSKIKQKKQFVWDKKKRNYVQKLVGKGQKIKLSSKIKNESGALVFSTDKQFYKKWSETTKKRIQYVGEEEQYQSSTNKLYDSKKLDSSSIKSEIKTKQQLLKEKKLEKKKKQTEETFKKIRLNGFKKVKRNLEVNGMIRANKKREANQLNLKLNPKRKRQKKRKK